MNLSSSLRRLAPIALGFALTAMAYWSGLSGGFFFDDEANIVQVSGIRLDHISSDTIGQALSSGHSGLYGRPISQLSFAFNYFVSGLDPFAFKLTNLVIHCLNGILIFLLAGTLIAETGREQDSKSTRLLAAIVALAWIIHPIQLTSVLYVVQRMTSLSAIFLLSGLLLYMRARQRPVLGTAGLLSILLAWAFFWPMSIYSKETGVLFPGFVAAYELIIHRSAKGKLDTVGRAVLILAIVSVAMATLYLVSPSAQWIWTSYQFRGFSPVERLLTEARVIWEYVGLIAAPRLEAFGLYHDDIPISTGLFSPWTTAPALLGIGALLWLAWWTRARSPLVAFGLTWFLIGHSLESSFLPLEIAHEHRNYLPIFGLYLLPIGAMANMAKMTGLQRTVIITLCAAIIGYFGFTTALRAHMFGDALRRTQIEAQHHPDSAIANYEAGALLARAFAADRRDPVPYVLGRKHFERAGALDPTFKLSFLGLTHFDCLAGAPVDRGSLKEFARRLRETAFAPGDQNVLFNLKEMAIAGTTCLARPDIDRLFLAALANPTASAAVQAILYSWHADYLWLREQDIEGARISLARSLALVPWNPSNRLKNAQLMLIAGETTEAHRLLLKLRDMNLSLEERKTANELLADLEKMDH